MSAVPRPTIRDVRIVHLKTIEDLGTMEMAWEPGGRIGFQRGGGSIVEIQTDQGLVGIGPGIDPNLLPAVRARLVGQDPFATEQHAATLRYFAQGSPYRGSAGVDIALWDLIGKACGQPLFRLWGGAREKVPAYASMVQLSTPEERARLGVALRAEGWQAMKLRIHHATLKEDVETVERVREAVGESMTLMVDANQAQSSGNWQPGVLWDYRRAVETAKELQRLGCYWLEEPLPRYAYKDLARLREQVEIPIAGGENNRGLHEFLQMLQEGAYDILQPESMVNGGVTEARKIGLLAEAFGKKVALHHGGRGLGTVAHLHLTAAWPHAPYLELLHDPPAGAYQHGFSILRDPPVVDAEGYVAVPQGHGLGVEINRDLVIDG